MKNMNKKLWYITSMVSFLILLIILPRLPEQIPIHFTMDWEVDQYGPKYFILLLGIIPLLVCLTYDWMEKREQMDGKPTLSKRGTKTTKAVLVLLALFVQWFTVLFAIRPESPYKTLIKVAVGILLIGLGNYLPKIHKNYLLGIRTPWTLKSEMSWRKTHRLGGYLFVMIGMLYLVSSIIKTSIAFKITNGAMIIALVIIVVYSYVIYRKWRTKETKTEL